MHKILEFIKSNNKTKIAEKVGVSKQHIRTLASDGFTNPSLVFYDICKLFFIDIAKLNIKNYNDVLKKEKEKRGISFSEIEEVTCHNKNSESRCIYFNQRSVKLFIKIYKFWKNGL